MTDPAGVLMVVTAVLVGGVIGSFLNVVIARVPAGLSVVTPRSRCPRCLTPIAWYDNLPLVSWLALRARCRACGAPIAWRYPMIEAAGAAAAWMALTQEGPSPRALAQFTLVSLLLVLAAIDLDTWLLPHKLTWPLIGLGLAAAAVGWAPAPSLSSSALGAALGLGGFALVSLAGERLLKKEALGFGDVFLLGGLGAWLGVGALLPVVLLASLQGSAVGVALILLGRSQPGPGGPPVPSPGAADALPAEQPGEAPPVVPSSTEPPSAGGASTDEASTDEASTDEASTDEASTDEELPWVPPRHALPFGPFLVAGALEWLWLGERLSRAVPLFGIFR